MDKQNCIHKREGPNPNNEKLIYKSTVNMQIILFNDERIVALIWRKKFHFIAEIFSFNRNIDIFVSSSFFEEFFSLGAMERKLYLIGD